MNTTTLKLISMPWASTVRPSLAIGTLLANVKASGIQADAFYPNLPFASLVTPELYELFSETPSLFPVGEHLFGVDLFGREELQSDHYLATVFDRLPDKDRLFGKLLQIRDKVIPSFLSYCVETIIKGEPDVVGFSCTFNQVLPSLALARRLKIERPSIRVIMGGACVHGEMGQEYARAFPEWIDAVFTGEADHLLTQYLQAVASSQEPVVFPGIAMAGTAYQEGIPFERLDTNEVPDYDDFFRQREAVLHQGGAAAFVKNLPFESSRGCWWGAKNHCTFCGLNNLGMAYRRKSPERIVGELCTLSRRHNCVSFMAADNILDFKAYIELLPRLQALNMDFKLFYEIKANIRKTDVAMLWNAGVRYVQPGIESFSQHVLELMRKGVSPLQNIAFLKWATEYGMQTIYNILVGFHNESKEDYEEMIAYIQKIQHLPPPSGPASQVEVHRFSPMFYDPGKFGIPELRTYGYYQHLYPQERVCYERIAYYFDNHSSLSKDVQQKISELNELISDWTNNPRQWRAVLGAGFIQVADGDHYLYVLTDPIQILIFILTDVMTSWASIKKQLEHWEIKEEAAQKALESLMDQNVIAGDGAHYLCLIPYSRPRQTQELYEWFESHCAGVLFSRQDTRGVYTIHAT